MDGAKRRAVVQHLAAALAPVLDKGLVDCQLAHRLVREYLAAAPASLAADAARALSGDALLHVVHTHDGAAAACMALAYGTARDRKKAVRALKGHVAAAARDEWGHLALACALSVVDDTALLNKVVVGELLVRWSGLGGYGGGVGCMRVGGWVGGWRASPGSPVTIVCRRADRCVAMTSVDPERAGGAPRGPAGACPRAPGLARPPPPPPPTSTTTTTTRGHRRACRPPPRAPPPTTFA